LQVASMGQPVELHHDELYVFQHSIGPTMPVTR
jgi:hypothetical protein